MSLSSEAYQAGLSDGRNGIELDYNTYLSLLQDLATNDDVRNLSRLGEQYEDGWAVGNEQRKRREAERELDQDPNTNPWIAMRREETD